MKKKKMILMIPFLFLIMGMSACEDNEPQYEIYENHEISACGVKDPLRNLEWLSEEIKKHSYAKSLEIYVYEENMTNDECIVIVLYTNYQGHVVFSCDGNILFSGEYHIIENTLVTSEKKYLGMPPQPCYECKDFYATHHNKGLIYSKQISK